MFTAIWKFFSDEATFKRVSFVLISIAATAAVDGAFDKLIPETWDWLVKVAYVVNPLLAAQGAGPRKAPDAK